MATKDMKRITIYIDKKYYLKIKILAAKADRKVSYYINEIFEKALKKESK